MKAAPELHSDRIRALLDQQSSPCISLYMPLTAGGPDARENQIRFDNLCEAAARRLADLDLRKADVDELLQPIRAIATPAGDSPLRSAPGGGLAVLRSRSAFETFLLADPCHETLIVSPHFHVKPLIRAAGSNGRFFLLALSQHQAHLYECSRATLREVDAPDLPQGLDEAIPTDDTERSLQFHTRTQPRVGDRNRDAQLFGHGAGLDDKNDSLYRYCRRVADVVASRLRGLRDPLVLASVDYLAAIYRAQNTYPHLLDQAVIGNPEHRRREELRDEAWDAVAPLFRRVQQEAQARYEEALAKHQASSDLAEILPAAADARVAALFVNAEREQFGIFRPETHEVQLQERSDRGEDLLNLAAVNVLKTGGAVYALSSSEMPAGGLAGATFRF